MSLYISLQTDTSSMVSKKSQVDPNPRHSTHDVRHAAALKSTTPPSANHQSAYTANQKSAPIDSVDFHQPAVNSATTASSNRINSTAVNSTAVNSMTSSSATNNPSTRVQSAVSVQSVVSPANTSIASNGLPTSSERVLRQRSAPPPSESALSPGKFYRKRSSFPPSSAAAGNLTESFQTTSQKIAISRTIWEEKNVMLRRNRHLKHFPVPPSVSSSFASVPSR